MEGAGAGGGICRAVVLGYVLDDGAVGAGGRGVAWAVAAATADTRRYLVEVELAPGSGTKGDESGPWVCYKRCGVWGYRRGAGCVGSNRRSQLALNLITMVVVFV